MKIHGVYQPTIKGGWFVNSITWTIALWLAHPVFLLFYVLSLHINSLVLGLVLGLGIPSTLYLVYRVQQYFVQFFLRSIQLMLTNMFIEYMIERDAGFEEFYNSMQKDFNAEVLRAYKKAEASNAS